MDHYYPGEDTVTAEAGLIQAFCNENEVTEMVITPDSNVAETEQLLEAMLDSGATCVTKSTTELGVHAQIIGELRAKKGKKVWMYSEFVSARVDSTWLPDLDSFPSRKSNSASRQNSANLAPVSTLCVSRATHQLITLMSNHPIERLKSCAAKRDKVLNFAKSESKSKKETKTEGKTSSGRPRQRKPQKKKCDS